MNKLRVLELFGGIGACSKALEKLGIDYEIADYVEIDKYAVKSFNAIHNTNFEPQDITTWDKDIEVDLVMHGSPCQDFSIAGLQAGGDEGSGTRSSLMYETIRIVKKLKPKYVIWENVKNIISKRHIHNFEAYITQMRLLGYWSYYKILNAKDYGIPQNRERVFVVSIRSDINSYGSHIFNYQFPPKQELKLKLKDMLEDNVDEKYYLKKDKLQKLIYNTSAKKENEPYVIGGIGQKDSNKNTQWKQQNRVYDDDIMLSLTTIYQPYYLIKNATKTGYLKAYNGDGIDLLQLNSQTRRGRVANNIIQTLDTMGGEGKAVVTDDYRIRKLTPKECWRLMGFDDEDFEKAEKVNSNTQLYKQAGNSIVVNVLMAIFKEMI